MDKPLFSARRSRRRGPRLGSPDLGILAAIPISGPFLPFGSAAESIGSGWPPPEPASIRDSRLERVP